jgi:cardiolipin-specific phospholipase
VGLSEKFSSVYSLDLLGWGLSSRPEYKLLSQSSEDQKIRTAEDFFVESLEAWRKQQNIATMVLAGHSMGGYISVAYAERYPERVAKLVLISPVGVPSDSASAEERITRARQQSLFFRALSTTWYYLFEWNHTVGGVLRTLSESRASKISSRYVERRLPAVSDSSEQEALSEYLVANSLLPGSGEYCVQSFLTSSLQGRMPTEQRIPHLRVPSVSFLYGSRDWMDINGGLRTEARTKGAKPEVAVYSVSDAGHLLMLDNYKEFNAGIIEAAGLKTESCPSPERVHPTEKHYQTPEVIVQQSGIQGETVQPLQVVTP